MKGAPAACATVLPRRKTLQKEDITAAIHKTENFDFLVDSVGRSTPPPPP